MYKYIGNTEGYRQIVLYTPKKRNIEPLIGAENI